MAGPCRKQTYKLTGERDVRIEQEQVLELMCVDYMNSARSAVDL